VRRENLLALMSRRLEDVRLAVLMLEGIELKGRCCVVALGIATDGVKIPLGLWDGSTENATVAKALLSNLVARGLDLGQGVLCVGSPRPSRSRSPHRRSMLCGDVRRPQMSPSPSRGAWVYSHHQRSRPTA